MVNSTNLLATVTRQVKYENGEKGYSHTWDYEVDRVEESFSPHRYVERYVQIRLIAARVKFLVPEEKTKNNELR